MSALDTHVVSFWRIPNKPRSPGANIQFSTTATATGMTQVYGRARVNLRDFDTSLGSVSGIEDPGVAGAMVAILSGEVARQILESMIDGSGEGLVLKVELVRLASSMEWRTPTHSPMYQVVKAVATRPIGPEIVLSLRPYSAKGA